MVSKSEYINQFLSQLNVWSIKIDRLHNELNNVSEDKKIKHEEIVNDLVNKHHILKSRIETVIEASDDTWIDLKKELDQKWIDMRNAMFHAASVFFN